MMDNFDPPLFYNEDACKYQLVHQALHQQSLDMIKFFVDLGPSFIFQSNYYHKVPIEYVTYDYRENEKEERTKARLDILQYLLRKSVSHSNSNESIGGLFAKNSEGKLILDHLVETFGETITWDCVEKALSNLTGLRILHQTIKHSPQYCGEVLHRFPDAVFERDFENRLPVHVALATGMRGSRELTSIFNINHSHLKDVDPVTKWPLFALAGNSSCDLRTIYQLLSKHPEHVEITYDDDSKKKSIPMPEVTCKRRKIRK